MEYNCKECNKVLSSKRNLEKHYNSIQHKIKINGDDRYTCDICNKIYSNSYKLERHRRDVICGRSYNCSFCNETFNTIKKYRKHINLKRHIKKKNIEHNENDLLECSYCKTECLSTTAFKKHIKTKTHYNNWYNIEKEKTVLCDSALKIQPVEKHDYPYELNRIYNGYLKKE